MVLGGCGLGVALEPVLQEYPGSDLMESDSDLQVVVPVPDSVVQPESGVALVLDSVLEMILEPHPDLIPTLGSDLEEVPGPVLIMVLGSDLEVALACWGEAADAEEPGGGLGAVCVMWAGVWHPLLLGLLGLELPGRG